MAETSYRFGASRFGTIQWGGYEVETYPLLFKVYYTSTAIELDWSDATTAEQYQIQVSETPDFSGTLLVDTTTNSSSHDYTDSGTDDTKRWWRWRHATGGTGFGPWSEVGSFWVNSGGSQDVTVGRNNWKLFDPDDETDEYIFPLYPYHAVTFANIYRAKTRNRLGELLSEYLTQKASIVLDYAACGYITHVHYRELRRFNEEIKTFFIATFKDNEIENPVPNIWKVQYEVDPELSMIALGRTDLMTGTLRFEEV